MQFIKIIIRVDVSKILLCCVAFKQNMLDTKRLYNFYNTSWLMCTQLNKLSKDASRSSNLSY